MNLPPHDITRARMIRDAAFTKAAVAASDAFQSDATAMPQYKGKLRMVTPCPNCGGRLKAYGAFLLNGRADVRCNICGWKP